MYIDDFNQIVGVACLQQLKIAIFQAIFNLSLNFQVHGTPLTAVAARNAVCNLECEQNWAKFPRLGAIKVLTHMTPYLTQMTLGAIVETGPIRKLI